jgi:hypothetical protein
MRILSYFCLSMILAINLVPKGFAKCPADSHPPKEISGEVKEPDTHFVYKSDVEIKNDGQIILNHCVHNKHHTPLVFQWEKVNFVRPPWHPLPPDEIQQDPHPIVNYRSQPDTDAPIFYTQSKKRRSAAVYIEKKEAGAKILKSQFSTVFYDMEKRIRKLDVKITSVFKEGRIFQEIEREPHDIIVALSGINEKVNQEQTYDIVRQLNFYGDKLSVSPLIKGMSQQQSTWLPSKMGREMMFIIQPPPTAMKFVKFSIPANVVKQTTAVIAVLDQAGKFIASGRYALFVPNLN